MATIREGNKKVLVVVDAQVGVIEGKWQSPQVIENINTAVAKARAGSVPVIWVQHDDDELLHGTAEWQLVPELVPAEGELHIYKHHNSSFEGTPLEEQLAELGASHIVLAGAATNWCIRATAYAALDRGYDLTLLEDAHTTVESVEFEDGVVVEAPNVVRELNMVMNWVSYPGRSNTSLSVDELDFAENDK